MGHDHTQHGHDHRVSPDADQRKLAIALGLILVFMAGEIVAAIMASSLALFSDAAHMLTDAAAIALALFAARLAKRPAEGAYSFGFGRAEILAAQFNGATLLVLGSLIVIEGIRRLINPPDVEGAIVLIVALVGIVVNYVAMRFIASAERRSLNVEGAYQHILTDMFAFVATAVAGAVIMATGFEQADGIASLIVAALMLRSAYGLLMASGRVFLEAAPSGINVQDVGMALARHPRVTEVHDLHVWEVTSGFPALSAHIVCVSHEDCHEIRRDLERTLHDDFSIDHTTLQVDHAGENLLAIEGS